jgi:pimeloyl-ACP methyl ester carboxylesterase
MLHPVIPEPTEHALMKVAVALGALFLTLLAAAYYGWPALSKPLLVQLNRGSAGVAAYQVSAAGHRIHYLAGGSGEPVVLLHGIFAEKDHWVDFARSLEGRWRVVVPDLPGFGETGREPGQVYDYDAQVERLAALLDALRLPRVHLAGSSMGGTLAALFAQRHPQRVASVAFIGAPHGIRTARPSAMDALIEAGSAPLVPRSATEFDAMLDLLFHERPFLPHPVMALARQQALAEADARLPLWQAQLKDRHLLHERLPGLRAPLLVLWGAHDRLFDASGVEAVRARQPFAVVRVLPGTGHLPMMERPADSARAYSAFLHALPAQGRIGAGAAWPEGRGLVSLHHSP